MIDNIFSNLPVFAKSLKSPWRLAKALVKLRNNVNILAPNRSRQSDGSIGDAAHRGRRSDHNAWIKDGNIGIVSAVDITHDPTNGCDCHILANALVTAKDRRIKYIIWNKKIISSRDWVWKAYRGKNPHTKHLHISVKSKKHEYDAEDNWAIELLR